MGAGGHNPFSGADHLVAVQLPPVGAVGAPGVNRRLKQLHGESNEMIMCLFFTFEFLYIVDYVDRSPYIESSLHPWDECLHKEIGESIH